MGTQGHEVPFERNSGFGHHGIRLHDEGEGRDQIGANRSSQLNEMTRQAYEDGLYGVDGASYKAALAAARKE